MPAELPQDFSVVPTAVTYPAGATSGTAVVQAVCELSDGRSAVIVDTTPFHPVDHRWPDQGPDWGVIATGQREWLVVDCVLAAGADATEIANGPENELYLGSEIPVRRGEEGWNFYVAHIVDGPGPVVGEEVQLKVNAAHRRNLSAGHTGCHVAALALNAALASRWRKDIPADGLGQPDFDRQAIVSSRIVEEGSIDVYRLGKSLRKKGFDAEGLPEALGVLTAQINSLLASWVAADCPITWETAGPGLTDLRTWICTLPQGVQRTPCGGTHLSDLGELAQLAVSLELVEAELTMRTAAVLR